MGYGGNKIKGKMTLQRIESPLCICNTTINLCDQKKKSNSEYDGKLSSPPGRASYQESVKDGELGAGGCG